MAAFQRPVTRLADLLDYYKAVKMEENLAYARISAGFDERGVFETLKRRRRNIDADYAKRLCPKDHHTFALLGDLEMFLLSTRFFKDQEALDSVAHEEAHRDAATRAGLAVAGFSCWLALTDSDDVTYVLSTQVVVDRMVSHEDYKRISEAPKVCSYFDLFH